MNNKISDIKSTAKVNIENSVLISKEIKTKITEATKKSTKEVADSKPKLVIKIPLPLGKGYKIIKLDSIIDNLLKGLGVALLALVLAKIASLLFDSLKDLLGGDVSDGDISDAMSKIDIDSVISDSKLEYENTENENSEFNMDDLISTNSIVSDSIISPISPRRNTPNNNKYSIDKRNRDDILESSAVSDRNSSNKNITKNPNYGSYLD